MAHAPTLRTLVEGEGCPALPGVFDGISARIADALGAEIAIGCVTLIEVVAPAPRGRWGALPSLVRRMSMPRARSAAARRGSLDPGRGCTVNARRRGTRQARPPLADAGLAEAGPRAPARRRGLAPGRS